MYGTRGRVTEDVGVLRPDQHNEAVTGRHIRVGRVVKELQTLARRFVLAFERCVMRRPQVSRALEQLWQVSAVHPGQISVAAFRGKVVPGDPESAVHEERGQESGIRGQG